MGPRSHERGNYAVRAVAAGAGNLLQWGRVLARTAPGHGRDERAPPSCQTIVKPTALGPVANTDTKLLTYRLFQKGRVLAQDAVALYVILWRSCASPLPSASRNLTQPSCRCSPGHPIRERLPDQQRMAQALHLARSEGHERYLGCNLMHHIVLASSHQHLMAEAPESEGRFWISTTVTQRPVVLSRLRPLPKAPAGSGR